MPCALALLRARRYARREQRSAMFRRRVDALRAFYVFFC
jgi:hypothetical protein